MTRSAIDDDELLAQLSRPDAYPWNPVNVEVIETHISWVFLAGERVIKVKRPVHFAFVDHSTVERRRHSCEDEVRLNRRLTDEVYLGVVPITLSEGRLAVDGEGERIEWATLMRRLPAERMLDRLLATGRAPSNLADRLARRLIPFHLQRAALCGGERYGSSTAVASVLTENLNELRAFSGVYLGSVQLDIVARAITAFLSDHELMLAERVAGGWIRDGHGDLRPEHICLEDHDRTEIFDCVEFNPALRCADVVSDLAFLLMELERVGADDVGRQVEQRYREAGIELPPSLLRLYRAHRALVRAKVDCLTLSGELRAHPDLPDEAASYLNLATRAVLTIRPFLVAMTGLSGTGKSHVAQHVAAATGAVIHASDTVRKDLARVSGESAAAWEQGIYSSEWTDRTYDRLRQLAALDLAAARPVVLDATYLDSQRRNEVARLGQEMGVPTFFVETICDQATVAERLTARAARHDSASDATLDTYRRQKDDAGREPPAFPESVSPVTVDTTHASAELIDPIFTAFISMGVIVPRVPESSSPIVTPL